MESENQEISAMASSSTNRSSCSRKRVEWFLESCKVIRESSQRVEKSSFVEVMEAEGKDSTRRLDFARHPHPAGQEVVHQALLLLAEFVEVVLEGEEGFVEGQERGADGAGIGVDAFHERLSKGKEVERAVFESTTIDYKTTMLQAD